METYTTKQREDWDDICDIWRPNRNKTKGQKRRDGRAENGCEKKMMCKDINVCWTEDGKEHEKKRKKERAVECRKEKESDGMRETRRGKSRAHEIKLSGRV